MKHLTSASVHYFRLSTARWERILDRLQASGFGGVDLYIPWGVHEKDRGDYDFGDGDRSLDIARFLSLVEERGLWVILRPGPHVNAELPNFGLPDRIVRDPGIQARSPGGNQVICPFMPEPFPAPSYASELFLEETAKWFGALGPVIGDFLEKPGFVKMVQVDNEASLFFRDGPFDQDYRPEAAAMHRQWLKDQSLEPHDPPVRLEPGTDGLRRALLWIRFRQWLIVEALTRMRGFLQDAGVKGPVFTHNLPPGGILSPVSPSRLKDAVDRVTTDVYVSEGEV
ncbi:MAG: beta-galactosidase, partial [Pseudomonadota bacterium]